MRAKWTTSGSAPENQVSWLYDSDIKIRDTSVYIVFSVQVLFLNSEKKNWIFQRFCHICQFQNLRLGVCLAMCLKVPEYEAECAYKLYAYERKVYLAEKCISEQFELQKWGWKITQMRRIGKNQNPNSLNIMEQMSTNRCTSSVKCHLGAGFIESLRFTPLQNWIANLGKTPQNTL